VTGRPDDQVGTWFAPHRRQKRAVADSGKPQFTHDCTPVSARLRTSRLEAAHIASTPLTCAALARLDGQDGATGHCGGVAGHSGWAAVGIAAGGNAAGGIAAGGIAACGVMAAGWLMACRTLGSGSGDGTGKEGEVGASGSGHRAWTEGCMAGPGVVGAIVGSDEGPLG
jgi:hypothetical protein